MAKKSLLVARIFIERARQKSFQSVTHTIGVTFNVILPSSSPEKFHFESSPEKPFVAGVNRLMVSSLADTVDVETKRLEAFNGYVRTSVAGNNPDLSKAAQAVKSMSMIKRRLQREGFDEYSASFSEQIEAILWAAKVDAVWFEEYSQASGKDSFTKYSVDDLNQLLESAVDLLNKG